MPRSSATSRSAPKKNFKNLTQVNPLLGSYYPSSRKQKVSPETTGEIISENMKTLTATTHGKGVREKAQLKSD